MRSERRSGFVLPVVLLCLLTLTAVAHGALALARHQRVAARAEAAAVQTRMAAEAGVRIGEAALDVALRDALRRGEIRQVGPLALGGGSRAWAEMERIRPEWIWVVGTGRTIRGQLTGVRRAGRLLWSLEAGPRLGALGVGVEHGGALLVPPGGAVEGSDAVGAPADWAPEACAPHAELLDSVFGTGGPRPAGRLTEPDPADEGRPGDGFPLDAVPRLGLLGGRELAGRASLVLPGGSVTPNAVVGLDGCRTALASNWGSPADPAGPCGRHAPLVVSSGSVVLEGGEGQGILVVGGDLTLRGDVRFVGLALVGGDLRVESGARLRGAARIRKSAVVAGRVRASPCGVVRALAANPDLARPRVVPGSGWIPVP